MKRIYNFIHIGKCGGSTIWNVLNSRKIKLASQMTYIHLGKIRHQPHVSNIITLRNPIRRFISAFYWRYYLVVEEKAQQHKYKNEYEKLSELKTVEAFAQNIKQNGDSIYKGDINSGNFIHQCKQDIYWYLEDIYHRNNPKKVEKIIALENLDEDMENHFGITNIGLHIHNASGRNYDKSLTKDSYDVLRDVLDMDYKCIDKFYEWGKLTEKQYKLLTTYEI